MTERLSGPDPLLSSDNGTGSTPPETGAESSNVVGRPATEKHPRAFHESTETAETEAEPLTEREAVAEGGSFDGVAPLQDIERPNR